MSAIGYIQVHAYTSRAQIPLKDVAVMISDKNGQSIALRLTDRNGKIAPIPITVPDISAGTSPNTGIVPFETISIHARLDNFEQIQADRVQVFPNIITLQNLEMIPLSELPQKWTEREDFNTPPQNL